MRVFSITRDLARLTKIERLIQRNPSLSFRTLHNNIGGGRQSFVMFFQGRAEALAKVKTEYLAHPPEYMESLDLVEENRSGLYLFAVERTGENPLDVAAYIEQHLGPETVSVLHKSIAGTTWHIVTRNVDAVDAFIKELQDAIDSVADQFKNPLPRYRMMPRSGAANIVSADVTLAPMEEALLTLAVRMGYYEQPKRNRIQDIARVADLPTSTAHYRLKRAEKTALGIYAESS